MEINRVGIDMFQKVLSPDVKALHMLAFGAALGSNVWTTFFVGPISYANLPRQQFGNLMAVLFPSYFTFQAAATGILVGTMAYQHAVIRKHPFDIMDATVYQAFTLATSTAACLFNSLVITPASSKLMYERHRQEKAEGKSYDDAGVSDKMDALNKEFAGLHSTSTILNLVSLGGVVFHGLVSLAVHVSSLWILAAAAAAVALAVGSASLAHPVMTRAQSTLGGLAFSSGR